MTRKPVTASAHVAPPSGETLGLERLVFFSDAVFAIAITLLALEIHLPQGMDEADNGTLLRALLNLGPNYLAFVIGFLVIAVFWTGHHRRFNFIRTYDKRLVWLNLLLLMGIAFIPFPTSVIAESGNRTATIFFALTMMVIGLTHLAIWLYASAGHRLLEPGIARAQIRHETLGLLVTPGVFALSIAIAFINEDAAKYTWLLLALLPLALREPWRRDE